MTAPTLLVLRMFLSDPDRELYGRQVCEATGLQSGTVQPILARLRDYGWLQERWESIDPQRAERPPRHYYQLSPKGNQRAADLLKRAAHRPHLRRLLSRRNNVPRGTTEVDPLAAFRFTVNGAFPRIDTVTDAIGLGVQPSIALGDAPADRLPPYVPRDCDAELVEAVAAGGLVIVRGPACCGKTRTAWEAVRTLPDRVLVVPGRTGALRELMRSGHRLANAVVWLDDIGTFLSSGELTGVLVSQLCAFDQSDVTIVGTADDRDWARRTALGQRPPPTVDQGATVLAQARSIVTVKASLSETERRGLRAAQCVAEDPRIAALFLIGASATAYLSGALQASCRWQAYDNTDAVAHIGHALVRAAVDLHRIGLRTVDRRSLETLVAYYASEDLRDRLTPGLLRAGLAWACTPAGTGKAGLTGDDTAGYAALRYLVDQVAEPDAIPYAAWELALGIADVDDLFTVGVTAYHLGRTALAATAFQRAAKSGHPAAMTAMGVLVHHGGHIEEAERWYRTAALTHHHPAAAANLGFLRQAQGRSDDATGWWRLAAEAGDQAAMTALGAALHDRGRLPEAERWWRIAAEAGDLTAMRRLGDLYDDDGKLEQALRWWRRIGVANDDSTAILEFAMALEAQNKTAYADKLWRRAAALGDRTARRKLWLAGDTAKAVRLPSGFDITPRDNEVRLVIPTTPP